MARQYDLRYQKRHPIPGDPIPLVRERLDQEESQNLPLSLANDTSGDAILSAQFPTVFTRSASPSFPALSPHTSPQEPPKTGTARHSGIWVRHSGSRHSEGRHCRIPSPIRCLSTCGHPRSLSYVDDKKHAFKLCDGCDGLPEISKLAVLCMKDMGNSHKVDFIDWYKPGVYCLKCLKWR